MKLSRAREPSQVARAWRHHFPAGCNARTDEIYAKLFALGDNPTAAEVEDVIGNSSWTKLNCVGCHAEFTELMNMNFGGDQAAYWCLNCLRRAVDEYDVPQLGESA